MAGYLLPRNATPLEIAYSQVADLDPVVGTAVSAMRGTKLLAPPPDWLPFLVYEYGLGELTPYVPNLYELIDEGIRWQRVRGTPDAIARGLGWIGYAYDLEEFPTRRRRWNRYMAALDRVRDAEDPDLERIGGIADLSAPLRSVFWRGFAGYDVRAAETSRHRLSGARLAAFSGVRIATGGPKWSFGRDYDLSHPLTEADLTAAGVWLADPGGEGFTWGDFPWTSEGVTWADAGAARYRLMAAGLAALPAWIVFLDADDAPIGYRRARACRQVVASPTDVYVAGGAGYRPDPAGETVYVEALTDFGDGDGSLAASVGVVFGASPTDVARPGRLWCAPDEITGGTDPIGIGAVDIEFGRTVRERVRFLLTLDEV